MYRCKIIKDMFKGEPNVTFALDGSTKETKKAVLEDKLLRAHIEDGYCVFEYLGDTKPNFWMDFMIVLDEDIHEKYFKFSGTIIIKPDMWEEVADEK